MEFLDKLGNIANETYKFTTEKTSKIAKETKLKMQMNEKKSDIREIYEEIGKLVYKKHCKELETDIEEEIKVQIEKIDQLSNKIEDIRMQLLNLKDKKQCLNCFAQIEINANYCQNCGSKQNENIQKEEILEDLKQADISEEKKSEAQLIKENLQED